MFEIALDVTAEKVDLVKTNYDHINQFKKKIKTKTFVSDPGFSIEQRATRVSP